MSLSRKSSACLIILSGLVYFSVHLTRYNLAAVLQSLAADLSVDEAYIGLALTGHAVLYGAGQIINGIIGEKVPPRIFVTVGMLGSALCCGGVWLAHRADTVVALWCVNGLFQSMIWPSLVRCMAEMCDERTYHIGALSVSYAGVASSFAVYSLLAPLCLSFFSFRTAFLIPAVIGILTALCWFFFLPKGQQTLTNTTQVSTVKGRTLSVLWQAGIPLIAVGIVCHGFLRDGVQSWMPSMLSDIFRMPVATATVCTSLLPLFGVGTIFLADLLFRYTKNEISASLILWLVCTAAAAALFLFFPTNEVTAVLLLTLIHGCISGINHLLVSCLPRRFVPYGCVATVTGLTNAFTYVGSAVSGYGLARFRSMFGWRATVLLFGLVCVLGIAAALPVIRRKFFHKSSADA